MRVICAGLPKTGTKTMHVALHELGLKVWDLPEQFYFIPDQLTKALEEGCTDDEYREMFTDVDAVVDVPASILWEEIYHAFPEAKVSNM